MANDADAGDIGVAGRQQPFVDHLEHQKGIEEVMRDQRPRRRRGPPSTPHEVVRGRLKTAEKTVQDLQTAHQDELVRMRADNADLRQKAEQASHCRHIVGESLSSAAEAAGK
ncbi:hypothetical protein DL764_005769 [Monosporascus ibericus]|uniref:Uncharacterized protein n=1 Tax=Monosporascus ibericus TaxID=155417 RepID=A0A4Q4T7Q0_9PEZI|nr:hypothetical protein DL764_005769 [Monosporascus ibericus]